MLGFQGKILNWSKCTIIGYSWLIFCLEYLHFSPKVKLTSDFPFASISYQNLISALCSPKISWERFPFHLFSGRVCIKIFFLLVLVVFLFLFCILLSLLYTLKAIHITIAIEESEKFWCILSLANFFFLLLQIKTVFIA